MKFACHSGTPLNMEQMLTHRNVAPSWSLSQFVRQTLPMWRSWITVRTRWTKWSTNRTIMCSLTALVSASLNLSAWYRFRKLSSASWWSHWQIRALRVQFRTSRPCLVPLAATRTSTRSSSSPSHYQRMSFTARHFLARSMIKFSWVSHSPR